MFTDAWLRTILTPIFAAGCPEVYLALCLSCRKRFSVGEEFPTKCKTCSETPTVWKVTNLTQIPQILEEAL